MDEQRAAEVLRNIDARTRRIEQILPDLPTRQEMREAILHLAFDGLGAKEAASDAFVDNHGSNAISRRLGYEPNGSDWATRKGEPCRVNRWRLPRNDWESRRRDNIQIHNIEACHALLPLSPSDQANGLLGQST